MVEGVGLVGRLALALHLAERDTEALTWYTLALEHDPSNADTLFNMAVSQQRLGTQMSSVCAVSRPPSAAWEWDREGQGRLDGSWFDTIMLPCFPEFPPTANASLPESLE
jgi:hypothetical protein